MSGAAARSRDFGRHEDVPWRARRGAAHRLAPRAFRREGLGVRMAGPTAMDHGQAVVSQSIAVAGFAALRSALARAPRAAWDSASRRQSELMTMHDVLRALLVASLFLGCDATRPSDPPTASLLSVFGEPNASCRRRDGKAIESAAPGTRSPRRLRCATSYARRHRIPQRALPFRRTRASDPRAAAARCRRSA